MAGPRRAGLPPKPKSTPPLRRREIPVPRQPHPPIPRPQHMPGRHLPNPGEQRPPFIRTRQQPVIRPTLIPPPPNPRRKQRLRLGREIQHPTLLRIKQWLQPEPIPRGEQPPRLLVPDHERELPTQLPETPRPHLLVQVQRDLAVGPGVKTVPTRFQVRADPPVIVELSVDDDPQPSVLAGDRLDALGVVDRQERVAQPHPPARRNPGALRVRPTMPQGPGGAAHGGRVDGPVL